MIIHRCYVETTKPMSSIIITIDIEGWKTRELRDKIKKMLGARNG